MKKTEAADIHFGHVGGRLNWRDRQDEADPDDELIEPTPPEIIEVLGFDPAKYAKGEEPGVDDGAADKPDRTPDPA